MNYLNESLKKISLFEIIVVITAVLLVITIADIFGIYIDEIWIYIAVIFYVVFKLRKCTYGFLDSVENLFSKLPFKNLMVIVLLNIFFSYGMLYIFDYIVANTSIFDFILNSGLVSISGLKSSIIVFDFISTVIIAPISEEIIFRGIIFNKLYNFIELPYAILISSIIFGILHEPGSIISASVFGICMCIIYLKTENILVPILAHFVNNLFAELIYFIDVDALLFTNSILIFICSISAIISFILIFASIREEYFKIK